MRKWLLIALILIFVLPLGAQYNVQTLNSTTFMNLQTKHNYQTYFNITLVGNVSGTSIDNAPPGARADFNLCQDATGGRTWTWPGTFTGTSSITVSTTALACTQAAFITPDGTNWNNAGIGGGGGVSTLSINLNNTKYGLIVDGQQCFGTNVGTTNASNIVTCTGANFLTTAKTSQVMWATTGCCTTSRQYLGGQVLAESAITSVDSNTQVHVANNAGFTCSANAQCLLEWGTLNDTAISSAETDGNASTTQCPSYTVPAGLIVIHGKHFNTQPAQCAFGTQLGSAISYGISVSGQGQASSIFLVTPAFDNASGGGACGTTGCLFSAGQIVVSYLGVYGGGCGNCGTANDNLTAPGAGSQFFNVSFAGYAGSSSGEVGIATNGWRGTFVSIDGFGATGINYASASNANNICLWCFVGDTNQSNVIVTSGNNIDVGSDYGGSGTGSLVLVNGGSYHASGINAFACPQNGNVMVAANGGNVDLTSANLNLSTCTNVSAVTVQNAASTVRVRGSTLNSNGTGGSVKISAGTYVDSGGNTYATPIVQSGGTVIADGHSIKAICTGVATATSTLALISTGTSLTGTALTTACTGTTLDKGVPIEGARTLQNLSCTSSATTVSVACTVMTSHNGAAFASSGITCTMTAATSCFDTTHTLTVADGDLVTIQIVTGAAETGANIKANVIWN